MTTYTYTETDARNWAVAIQALGGHIVEVFAASGQWRVTVALSRLSSLRDTQTVWDFSWAPKSVLAQMGADARYFRAANASMRRMAAASR